MDEVPKKDCVSESNTIVEALQYESYFKNKQVTIKLISNQQILLDYVTPTHYTFLWFIVKYEGRTESHEQQFFVK